MKKLIFIATITLSFASCIQNDKKAVLDNAAKAAADTANFTTIQWLDSALSFGTINMGEKVVMKFRFKNTGTKPLFISNVTVGCGCTNPDYIKEAVASGAEGWVSGEFDTNKSHAGDVSKRITAFANTKGKTEHVLIFTGTIKGEEPKK